MTFVLHFFTGSFLNSHSHAQEFSVQALFIKSHNTIISLKDGSKLEAFILIAHQVRVWCFNLISKF